MKSYPVSILLLSSVRSGCVVMPVSTSPITMLVEPCVMAQAGSMLMLDFTLLPLASTPGARRYHWPEAGVAEVRPSGYSGSLTGDACT